MKYTIEEKEIYLVDLEDRIQEKKRFLMKKRRELLKLQNTNHFLRTVLVDYQRYHDTFLVERKKEEEAMIRLKDYVDRIIVNHKLTEEDLRATRKEQNHILREIHTIKKDLDEMVENNIDAI